MDISAPSDTDAGTPGLTDAQRIIADRTIRALAGEEALPRADQLTAVAALLREGARVLVVQATGWGKSAVYWTATAIRRAHGTGPTLVVSPLLSLMRDQVAAARRAGLAAATVNSGNVGEWTAIEESLRAGELDVLLISPERLAHPDFGRRVLHALTGRIGLLVVDEAHAVSDWGHDFRPDYRRVSDILRDLNPDTPVLATTATANARVTDDVARQLGAATLVMRGPLARKSLQLNVLDDMSPLQRYAWVADAIIGLPGSGIIYTLTVADAHRLTQAIRAIHGDRLAVAAYTGQLPGDERHHLEDALRDNTMKALIATSALGMGYDKPDLGFVVHVGSPPSPVSYYQQVGRAGRAIDHAVVVLLPSEADRGVWDYFATATIPDPRHMRTLLDELRSHPQPQSVVSLESSTGIRRTRVELMLKQLAVDGAVERMPDGWAATGQSWTYDAGHYDSIVDTRRRESAIMLSYIHRKRCLMALLTVALDDPAGDDCGRCSVCLGRLPAELPPAANPRTVDTISRSLRSDAHLLEPRKMWPGGAFGTGGRIPPRMAAEPGRVIIHADAPEWSDTLAAAYRGDTTALGDIAEAAVTALSAWKTEWAARPDVVVAMDLSAQGLSNSIADRVAAVGRLPRADITVTASRRPARHDSGAQEAALWRDILTVPHDAVADSAVLLVVDSTPTGWPITVAASRLRSAGATHVLPLLIHRPV